MDEMEAREHMVRTLAEFGQHAGMSDLAFDENGACLLVFDPRVAVYLVADPAAADLVLWSPIGELPEAFAAKVMRRLLYANLFWRETAGATIGLNPENDSVILSRRVPAAGLDAAGLAAAVEVMVETAEHLAELLEVADDEVASIEAEAVLPPHEHPIPANVIRG